MSDLIVKETHLPALLPPEEEAVRNDNYKFAMWLYLASEVVLFAVLIGGYALFRLNEPEAVRNVHKEVGIALVSLNTFLLLTSSWAMVMGLREIQRDNLPGMQRWLGITAALGTVFLILQYVEYSELAHLGITLDIASSAEAYSGFGMRFYAPTFFHGLHVAVGVFWCLLVMRRGSRGAFNSKRYTGVEVFGLYWHFVDVVWIILFTLIYLI
ncbi:MAG: heme-copper oxidase subunit III [Chloroflexi bacterium]|nr:heme-copper oxidase subunit III [Chloroflexota bacterium]